MKEVVSYREGKNEGTKEHGERETERVRLKPGVYLTCQKTWKDYCSLFDQPFKCGGRKLQYGCRKLCKEKNNYDLTENTKQAV
jgi:hypothetical protein